MPCRADFPPLAILLFFAMLSAPSSGSIARTSTAPAFEVLLLANNVKANNACRTVLKYT